MPLIPAQVTRIIQYFRAPSPLAVATVARSNRLTVADINGTQGTIRIGDPASLGGPKFSGYASDPQSFKGAGTVVPSGAIRIGMGSGLPGTQAPAGESSPLLDVIAAAQNGVATGGKKK